MPTKTSLPPPLEVTAEEEAKSAVANAINEYVAKQYSNLLAMHTTWNTGEPLLDGRTPYQFWDDSVRDAAVLALDDDENDPVQSYQSTVSRDKANTIYANLASKFFYPTVIAQNAEQSIDRTFGKVGDAVLYWSYKQDGWPSESGQQKQARLIHKCCMEGTAYTLDMVTEDGLDSELIPNEEILFPNLWQPNIQLQKRVFRVKLNMTYDEAEEAFGENKNWSKVEANKGWGDILTGIRPELKELFTGIVDEEQISILYVWERATQKQLKELKRKRKVNSWAKRAWYYNVIINNVPMFELDNVSPYKSGFLPISKMIFEFFAKTEYALGNSVSNKCKENKKWKDAWLTNLRWRGKLAGMPPQLVIGGHLNGEEVMLPAMFTSLPKDVDVKPVPGVVPITQSDINLMNMADQEINASTVEPSPESSATARTAMILQANAKELMQPFTQQLAFFAASRSFHILTASFQYLPKKSLAKIAVPDQTLEDGLTGTFEVIFKEPEDVLMTEVDNDAVKSEMDKLQSMGQDVSEDDLRRLMHSFSIKNDQEASAQSGEPMERIYVSPSHLKDIKFFLFADAADAMQDKDAMAQAQMTQDLPLMLQDQTGSIDFKEVWREFLRRRGYNNKLLARSETQPMPQQQPAQGPEMPPQAGGPTQPPSPANQVAQAAAGANGMGKLPNLPGV
jgi:hypothetical protein